MRTGREYVQLYVQGVNTNWCKPLVPLERLLSLNLDDAGNPTNAGWVQLANHNGHSCTSISKFWNFCWHSFAARPYWHSLKEIS